MKFHSKLNILPLGAAMLAVSVNAANLPTRMVNGQECYYYEVQPKETVYGLCREFGITKSQLVQYNPSVADGLRAGAVLYFPVSEFPELGAVDKNMTKSPSTDKKSKIHISPDNEAGRTYQKAAIHHVAKGETVYGICKRYGISESQLFELNPSLKDGLKHGTILMLPDSCQRPEPETNVAPVTPEVNETKDTTEADTASSTIPTIPAPVATGEDSIPESTSPAADLLSLIENRDSITPAASDKGQTSIAVILPFMLASENVDKQSQLYTEFYRGMLLAADSLRNSDRNIVIRAYDSAASLDTVVNILGKPELEDIDVIITPDDNDQLDAIARFARERGAAVFNIFAVKNTDYQKNPDILQANITHSAVYPKAVTEFIRLYPQYTPVFLTSRDGKTDKKDFTALLREGLTLRDRDYIDITYNSYLKESDLASLNPEGYYMFVPESGTSTEFSHIAGALKTFRENHSDLNQVRIFGYPEWITFRGNSLENLHFLDATVYSRFYNDDSSYRSKDIAERYKNWYGSSMIQAVPVQGILGFDAGFYLIKAINETGGKLLDSKYYYDGVQSGFHFTGTGDGAGQVNDTLYFIEFRPSGLIDKHSVE